MITIRAGSRVYRLVQILSITGEFPARSLSLIGNNRDMQKLISKLNKIQDYRTHKDGVVYTIRLISVSGKRGDRTIRLHRSALPILDELHPGLQEYYLSNFKNHKFSGDHHHILRNHRVAEAVALFSAAGLEARPYILPPLQTEKHLPVITPDNPSFYIARDFKGSEAGEMKKNMYTRIVGAVFSPGGCYAVYNTRDAVMKWIGYGEMKANVRVLDLIHHNTNHYPEKLTRALLLGSNADIALKTLTESASKSRKDLRFDQVYHHIYFIPLDDNGINLIRVLSYPDWNEEILEILADPSHRCINQTWEYDLLVDSTYVLLHLDSDIARLQRFRDAVLSHPELTFEIVGYDWQRSFLERYLGNQVSIRTLANHQLAEWLGIS